MKKKIISVVLTAVMVISSAQFIGTKRVLAETDTSGIDGFVSRLYDVCLNRSASRNEVNYWTNTILAEGNTGVSLAYEFVFSDEFNSKPMSNEAFVSCMYSALMGRDASNDPDGLAYWANLMDEGMRRVDIFTGFANSDEFFNICQSYKVVAGTAVVGKDPHEFVGINYFTNRCYSEILERNCDRAGMEYWSNTLASGATTGAALVDSFLFSNEYISKNMGNTDFILTLYRAVMGRNPATSEVTYWKSVIEAGRTDRQILSDFIGAPEFAEICSRYGIIPGTVGNGPAYARGEASRATFTILGFNEDLKYVLEEYMPDINYNYEAVDSMMYEVYLDQVLASGDGAPDLFVCDESYAREYICSENTIPVAELGITEADVSQMYGYTFQFGTDNNGNLKALAWQCTPSVVFYNRSVAQRTLGVSEPEQVANYFWSWDAVRYAADIVNSASNGEVKITVGVDEMYRSAIGKSSFMVNGQLGLDNACLDFLDLTKYFTDNNLTWNSTQWGDTWMACAMDETVLSYWGPLWLGRAQGFDSTYNPTAGDWGVVPAPVASFWGGNFLMASKYCKDKNLAGEIMRTICCDANVQTAMALNGEFVNNNAVMLSMANNSAWNLEMLSGQNPVNYLIQTAQGINYQHKESWIDTTFLVTIYAYDNGEISRSDASEFFANMMNW